MGCQKYILLALITLSLTISESCGVNSQVGLLDSTAVAQTTNNRKAEADRLREQGLKQFESNQLQKALQSWQQSLAIYREIKNRQGEAASLGLLGVVYHKLGNYRKAIDYYQQSLAIKKEIGNRQGIAASLDILGVAYGKLGNYRKAIDYYQQALAIKKEIGNRKDIADSLNNLGNAYHSLGDYKKAIDYHQQSLAISKAIGYRQGVANSLNNLGNAYHSLGDYKKVIDYHQQSLAISKEIGNRLGVAKSLGNLGNAYHSLGDYKKAIDYHQQSLAIKKEIGNCQGVANSLGNLGNAYRNLGDYRKAIDNYQQSLAIDKEIGYRLGEANSLGSLGNAYDSLGDYPKAIDYYQQSLAISKEMGNRLGVAKSLGNLGNAYHSLGDYKKAIDYYQQQLTISKEIGYRLGEANSLGNLGNAYHSLGDYKKAIDYHQQALAIFKEIGNLLGKANVLNNLGATLRKSGNLTAAENSLRQAIATWEQIRKLLLTKDSWKVSIFEEQAKTYRILQQVLVARKQPQQALVISEQGRTRGLVEILYRTRHNKPKQELIPPTLTLVQIQQVANKEKATLVEYFVTTNELYIWVIPPQGKIQFRSVSLPKDISLQQLVKTTRENQLYVRGRNGNSNSNNPPPKKDNSTNRLKRLHQLLIKPIADLLPQDEQQKVIFIPHQELFLVPFVALQDEKNKYLIEKHTILTAPSIQALSLNQQDKQTAKNPKTPILPRGKEVLIVGNPTMPKTKVGKDKKPLEQLEGAEEEAKKIAQMLKAKAIIGSQATESAIVQKMPSAKLIHFATHGLLDGFNAIGSSGAIAFNSDDINAIVSPGAIAFTPDGKHNGFLTTREIMEMFGLPGQQKLQADLVVLSACDTGKGDIRGEGVIGLSRAFMASGVPTLVVSLWKVPDEHTVKLMTEFYANVYERRLNKAQAMRQAMLKMLKDEDGDPDPRNWAAFTVIGKSQ